MRACILLVICLGVRGIAHAEPSPYCAGEYAEDLGALSTHARELEGKTDTYSYAVRTTASYECVSYGSDGNLKRTRTTATSYGTAFGYRRDGGDTLLLTNDHVAEWPAVTDSDHSVDGIPAGCKRTSDGLAIVDDDHDDYAADDIPLSRVVADPALDVAVLRAHAPLGVIPWRVGKSAALVARDVVEVRGFPLGEFRATNVGKVISAYDHDDQGIWNHDDFVVDALLTSGGSGSPVLALSCKTGELELVGIFHAHYTNASALNVVVAIDQVRDLMTTLKRSPRLDPASEPDSAARVHLADMIHRATDPSFFALGTLVASVTARDDGTFVFALFASDFPRTTQPLLVIEDRPAPGDDLKNFGKLGAVFVGGASGLHPCAPADVDAEVQGMFTHTLDRFRRDALAAFDYRTANTGANASREAFERAAKQRRALARMLEAEREPTQAIVDLVGKLTTQPAGAAIGFTQIIAGEKLTVAK
jgi:serine protease Do